MVWLIVLVSSCHFTVYNIPVGNPLRGLLRPVPRPYSGPGRGPRPAISGRPDPDRWSSHIGGRLVIKVVNGHGHGLQAELAGHRGSLRVSRRVRGR